MFISDRLNSERFYSDRLYSDRLKFDAFNFDRFNSEGTDLIGFKRTGAHRARSRTRGQNPLVIIGFTTFHRLCKRLNLSGGLSGLPEEVVDDPKKKKRQPKSVKCERCGVPLQDKYVLKRHVSFL